MTTSDAETDVKLNIIIIIIIMIIIVTMVPHCMKLMWSLMQGFGRANHEQSVELLKRKYPHYASITWRND